MIVWPSLALSTIVCVGSFAVGLYWGSAMFAAVVILLIVLSTKRGSTEFSTRGVARITRAGRAFLEWDSICEIHLGRYADGILFITSTSKLAIPGPLYWSKQNSEQACEIVNDQIEHRRIPFRWSPWTAFRRSHNVRFQ